MDRPFDRMIEEKLLLSACVKGDEIDIPYSPNKSWKDVGRVIFVRIKSLTKGAFQLKYHSTHHSSIKIQKVMIPHDVLVKRFRIADDQDDPEIGTPIPEEMKIDDIDYLINPLSPLYQERLSERFPEGLTKPEFTHRFNIPQLIDAKTVSDTVRRMLVESLESRMWNQLYTNISKGDDPCPTKLVNKD